MSFPRYPVYRDSGVEWLGEVPEHWETKPLKYSITRIEQGSSPQCDSGAADDGDWGVLKVGCGNGSRFDPTEQKALPLGVTPELQYEVRPGDILMSRGNTLSLVGAATLVEDVRPRLLLSDLLYRFRALPNRAEARFLVLSLRSPQARIQIERDASGMSASMKKISQGTIRELVLSLPPLPEQCLIAAFLDRETARIDALIAEQERLIELLAEKRQAVISHAVTKGLDPLAPMKDSGIAWLGEVPAHWEVVRLRRVGRVDQGNAFSHSIQGEEVGELPWFKVGDMNLPGNEVEMHRASNYVSAAVADAAGAGVFPAGTVIFPRVGAALLTNKRRLLTEPSIVDDNVYAFIPVRIEARFVHLTLLLLDMARLCSPGLVPTVTFSVINDHLVPVPPASEQAAIVEYLDKLSSKMNTLTTEARLAITLLQERRTALISAAVTGQIDVRGVA